MRPAPTASSLRHRSQTPVSFRAGEAIRLRGPRRRLQIREIRGEQPIAIRRQAVDRSGIAPSLAPSALRRPASGPAALTSLTLRASGTPASVPASVARRSCVRAAARPATLATPRSSRAAARLANGSSTEADESVASTERLAPRFSRVEYTVTAVAGRLSASASWAPARSAVTWAAASLPTAPTSSSSVASGRRRSSRRRASSSPISTAGPGASSRRSRIVFATEPRGARRLRRRPLLREERADARRPRTSSPRCFEAARASSSACRTASATPTSCASASASTVVLGGIVGFNVVSKGDGTFRRATSGPLVIESRTTIRASRASSTRSLAAGFEVELVDDIRPLQWSKLVMNLNNAVGALSDRPTPDLLLRRRVTGASSRAIMTRGARGPARRERCRPRASGRCPSRSFRSSSGSDAASSPRRRARR